MKERIFQNWISSVLGLAMVVFAGVLLFVPTNIELGKLEIWIIAGVGILLIFAKDKLIGILTKKAER